MRGLRIEPRGWASVGLGTSRRRAGDRGGGAGCLLRLSPADRRGAAVLRREPSPSRAAAIVGEQLALDPSTGAAERLTVLARACPALHKLGQVLARDRRLDPGLREQLQRLESMVPRVRIHVLRDQIERELGPLEPTRRSRWMPRPWPRPAWPWLSHFTTPDRSRGWCRPGRGVFKVLKPGSRSGWARTWHCLEDVGAYLDRVARPRDPSARLS